MWACQNGKMESRIILRIELTSRANDRVNEMCDRKGMTQVAMLSRLIEWFSEQSEIVQAVVLGQLPAEIAPDIVQLVLKKAAQGRKSK